MSLYNQYYAEDKDYEDRIQYGEQYSSLLYKMEEKLIFSSEDYEIENKIMYSVYFDDHIRKRAAWFFYKKDAEYYVDCFNRMIESQLAYSEALDFIRHKKTPFRIVKARYANNLLVAGLTSKGNWVTMDISHTMHAAKQFIKRAVATQISPDCWQLPQEADPVELQITELPGV